MERRSRSSATMASFSLTTLVLWWCLTDVSKVACVSPASRHHSLAGEDIPFSAESLLDDENNAESELLENTSEYAFAEAGGKIVL